MLTSRESCAVKEGEDGLSAADKSVGEICIIYESRG